MTAPATLTLVAVQARLAAHDLESPARFRALIDGLGERAAAAGGEHRLWVFPEAIGHFLPLALAPPGVLSSATVDQAFTALALRRPLSLLRGALDARSLVPRRALLHAIMPPADRIMRECFAALARRHRAWVVAGSHLAAHPDGRVTNRSYTFDPGGRLAGVTDKVNLVPGQEDGAPGGLGLGRGDPDRVPVVSTPWGGLATLICYDGFAEPHTSGERFCRVADRVDAAGADVIANPAANSWPWMGPWVFAEPGEHIDRHQQWKSEGLPASLAGLHRVRYGVTAHLCGAVLDLAFEGRSEILGRGPDGVEVLASAAGFRDAEVVVAEVPVRVHG